MVAKKKKQAHVRLVWRNNKDEFTHQFPRDQDEAPSWGQPGGQALGYRPQSLSPEPRKRDVDPSRPATDRPGSGEPSSLAPFGAPYLRHMQVAPYPPMLAKCYLDSNSNLQADSTIKLLDHRDMGFLRNIKTIRRDNVGHLLDAIGQTTLAEIAGINPSYLYQMGKGQGKASRNVNDEVALQIETKVSLPKGWMDTEHPSADLLALKAHVARALPLLKRSKLRDAAKDDEDLQSVISMWPHIAPEKRKSALDYLEHLMRASMDDAEEPQPEVTVVEASHKKRQPKIA